MTPADLKKTLVKNQTDNNGNVVLPDSAITSSDLDWLLKEVFKAAGNVTFTKTKITLSSGTEVTLAGDVQLFGATPVVSVKVVFDVTNVIDATLSASVSSSISLSNVVNKYISGADIPAIDFTSLTMSATPASKKFSANAQLSTWTIKAGHPNVQVKGVTLDLSYDSGTTTATVKGSVTVASNTFDVSYTMPGKFSVKGTLQSIDFKTLADALSEVAFDAPSNFPSIKLTSSTFTVNKDGGDLSISVSSTVNDWGELVLDVVDESGTWNFAAGFGSPKGWKLSQISSVFDPLNDITFENSALVIASFADGSFTFPHITLRDGVAKGINLQSTLDVTGSSNKVIDNVASLVKVTSVDVNAAIEDPLTDSFLDASLNAAAKILNVTMQNPGLKLVLTPEAELHGTFVVPVESKQLDVTGILSVTDTTAAFDAVATGDLTAPGGFQGVTLQQVAVQINVDFGGEIGLGLGGQLKLKNVARPYTFAFVFKTGTTIFNPVLLSTKIPKLDLPDIFGSVMNGGITLPAALADISFADIIIYWCDEPGTTLPNGDPATVGFAFHAAMDAWGWHAQGGIKMDFADNFSGSLAMDKVDLGNGAFTLTGNSKGGGPTLAFDTTKQSLAVSLDASVMGIDQTDIDADVSSDHLSFTLTENIPGFLGTSLAVQASNPLSFSFAANINLQVDVHTGPIELPQTSINLGSLHIQGGFTGSVHVSMNNGTFLLSITGGLSWQGQNWTLASPITMHTIISDITDIEHQITSHYISNAESIFNSLFDTADGYLTLVKNGVLTGGDSVLNVLWHVFGMVNPVKIANLLEQYGVHGDGSIHSDKAVHADTPQGPHTDSYVPPHGDANPHSDHGSSWHHLDVGHHVDTPQGPHGDTHVPPHADTNPHLDKGIHVDAGCRPTKPEPTA